MCSSDLLQATLRRPWAAPDPAQGFDGGVAKNMPIVSSVWPTNYYVVSRYTLEFAQAAGKVPSPTADLGFFPSERVRQARGDAGEVAAPHTDLLVASDGAGLGQQSSSSSTAGSGAFQYRFRSWRYNGFGIDLNVPTNGWVVIAQLFDPAWRIDIDGHPARPRRAEHMLMAVPVDAGAHRLEMEYRPRARRMYWPASTLLLATCAGLLIAAQRAGTRERTGEIATV